ncbi:hypothetical protein CALCODRAFT_558977 [Calocera cornea HHB12733]|uniref:Uncharacterized protein n=1 Tax=Calocera cornea HHB12733 TaxID=1353952 RepID=A0A165CG81_9BASI|nr:hypothetical protein CALCODRAFT_558977 [Calocera cornea HHB12733]
MFIAMQTRWQRELSAEIDGHLMCIDDTHNAKHSTTRSRCSLWPVETTGPSLDHPELWGLSHQRIRITQKEQFQTAGKEFAPWHSPSLWNTSSATGVPIRLGGQLFQEQRGIFLRKRITTNILNLLNCYGSEGLINLEAQARLKAEDDGSQDRFWTCHSCIAGANMYYLLFQSDEGKLYYVDMLATACFKASQHTTASSESITKSQWPPNLSSSYGTAALV